MKNKNEIIQLLLTEYDNSIKEMMIRKLTRLSDEDFNKMIKQLGYKEIRKGYYVVV